MSQLRSCYFCGTTAALAEYETLPADLRADDAASQQVVLCDRCQTKLTNVLAPILNRLGATGTNARTTESTEPSPATGPGTDVATQSDVTFTGTSSSSDARDTTTDPPTADATPEESSTADEWVGGEPGDVTMERRDTSPAVRTGPHDEDDTARRQRRDETDAEAGDEPDAEAGNGASDHEEGDGQSGDRAEGDEVDGHDGGGIDKTDETDGADKADGTDENVSRSAIDATATSATDAPATDGAEPLEDDLDRVYYKLLRFLRNREFPIPRAEAEAVAQSAYDLTAREATQVIQRAVDRGVLAERDGDLHRT
jgi:hypothetical protein